MLGGDVGGRRVEGQDFTIDVLLADPARNELRELTTVVEDDQRLVRRGGRLGRHEVLLLSQSTL